MKRILLLMVLAVAICQAAVQTLSQDTLKNYLTQGAPFDFILIDIRSSAEIMDLIGNKECLPYNLEWPEQFKAESAKIPKDFPVILYCRSGGRATGAANYLSANGYTRVYNAGGISTWDGPKVQPSKIKPLALLPEPSMRAKAGSLSFFQPNTAAPSLERALLLGFSGQSGRLVH